MPAKKNGKEKKREGRRSSSIRSWLVVAGACLIQFTLGPLYSFGNLNPYIVSYVRQRSHPKDLTGETATWIATISNGIQGFSMVLGAWMERKIGPRLTAIIGCCFISGGIILSYFAIKISFWLLLITYGVLVGAGVGMAFTPPISCSIRWIPERKGMVSGIVTAGTGVGAVIASAIQTVFINPHNIKPTGEYFTESGVLDRVPTVFLVLGGFSAVVQFLGCAFTTNPPGFAAPSEDTAGNSIKTTPPKKKGNKKTRFEQTKKSDSMGKIQASEEKDQSNNEHPEKSDCVLQEQSDCEETNNDEQAKLLSSPSTQKLDDVLSGQTQSSYSASDVIKWTDRLCQFFNTPKANCDQHTMKKKDMIEEETEEDKKLIRDKDEEHFDENDADDDDIGDDVHPFQFLKMGAFYKIWLIMFLSGVPLIFIATLFKVFGLTFISDDQFLTTVGIVGGAANGVGRIVFGFLADQISPKTAAVLHSALVSIFMLTLYATRVTGEVTFFIWVCVLFFGLGGLISIIPVTIAQISGHKYVSINYSLELSSWTIAGIGASFLFTTLQTVLDWPWLILLVSGFSVAQFVFTLLFYPKYEH